MGTSLPGSPNNGDEYGLKVGSGDSATIWHVKYDSSISDTYKWRMLGGAELYHEVTPFETTSSTSYVDLTTTGPTVTVPNAGIYLIHFQAVMVLGNNTDHWNVAVKIGSAATSDSDSATDTQTFGNDRETFHRLLEKTCAASDVVKVQYKTSGGTVGAYYRWMRVKPLRII